MGDRRTPFEEGNYYHIYNRGVDKRKIFFSKGDWEHFQKLLFLANTTSAVRKASRVQGNSLDSSWRKGEVLVDILAYAFMENHFHLLLYERQDGGISKFMRKLLTAYSMYMNKKYNRTGPLMCRPFRAKHVDSDEYLRWVLAYIHLNPLDQIQPKWKENGIAHLQKAENFLKHYKYSSYPDYLTSGQSDALTTRAEGVIVNKEVLPIDISAADDITSLLQEYAKQVHVDVGML